MQIYVVRVKPFLEAIARCASSVLKIIWDRSINTSAAFWIELLLIFLFEDCMFFLQTQISQIITN